MSARSPTIDKGKGKAREIHPSVTSAIDDAINTPLSVDTGSSTHRSTSSLSSSIDSSHTSSPRGTISRPPLSYQPVFPPMRPRLLSRLTETTMPTATLTYAAAPRRKWDAGAADNPGESSTSWMSSSPVETSSPFPDLDPETRLPIRRDSDAPSLHLQRTITDLLASPPSGNSYLPSFNIPRVGLPSLPNLPSIPGLPGRSSLDGIGSRRSVSSTSTNEDWGSWASGWWNGNKTKVDSTLSKEDQADTIEEEQEKHRRKYRTPKNPVVFCHGLLGFDYLGPASLPPLQISHWRGIREVLESNGVEVLITRVAATASIADRAATLEALIAEKYPGRHVNLVGHSMGGLDCRYLISQIQPKSFTPISLTTISTPHRGSPFADFLIDNVIGRERLPSLLSLLEAAKLPQSGDGSAFNALGTKAMRVFNSEVINREDVRYYSWGASFEPGLLDTFRWPHSVILSKEGPNDGLVSVESARWGEYRGTLLGVNHLDLVGWVNTVRYVFSEWTGNPIAFKPATFYLEVADYLAEQGF